MKTKTIILPADMHAKLIELSKSITTQSHRCTAMPYFFQIRTNERIPVPEGCGTEAWVCDGSFIESEEEIKERVLEYKEWPEDTPLFDLLPEYEVEEILEASGWRKVNYDYEEKYQNAFFTEKGCRDHIQANKHHYSEPVDYLTHAFRNKEMELIQEFLCALTGKDLHK